MRKYLENSVPWAATKGVPGHESCRIGPIENKNIEGGLPPSRVKRLDHHIDLPLISDEQGASGER
jgi:hypothetical protein